MARSRDLARSVADYYAARATVYDATAGFTDPEAELLRSPIKERYRALFAGHRVLEVACGTGYWTAVLGETAGSVLGIDLHSSVLSIAAERCKHLENVSFQEADAYTLDGVPSGFTAALGIWWWSHIPKARLGEFLLALHGRLEAGAFVLLVDQLTTERVAGRDPEGNTFVRRTLPDGRAFTIIKNYPSEAEVVAALAGQADGIEYVARRDEQSWSVMYGPRAPE